MYVKFPQNSQMDELKAKGKCVMTTGALFIISSASYLEHVLGISALVLIERPANYCQ